MSNPATLDDSSLLPPLQLPLMELPERPDLVEIAGRPGVLHTGTRTMKDGELVEQMLEMFALGRGCKAVARSVGISPHTCRAVRNALEASGRIAPLKRRLTARAAALIEDGLDILHDAMLSGALPPAQISVPLGIVADKMAAWAGEAQVVIEHRHSVASPAELNRELGNLVATLRSSTPPIDCESIEMPQEAQQISHTPDRATGNATAEPTPEASIQDGATSIPAGPGNDPDPRVVEGRGGGRHRPGAPNS